MSMTGKLKMCGKKTFINYFNFSFDMPTSNYMKRNDIFRNGIISKNLEMDCRGRRRIFRANLNNNF